MQAALLDDNDVFLRMEEVETPTARHLPKITSCDLPPGEYKWIADARNPFGGAFWPLTWLRQREKDALDVLAAEQAAAKLADRRAQRKLERERLEREVLSRLLRL